MGNFKDFYAESKWRKISALKLATNPCCEDHELSGQTVAGVDVHHCISLYDAWHLRYTWENLRTLCKECHSKYTSIERSKRGKPQTGYIVGKWDLK